MFIAASGKDLSKLTTKEQVHKEFGEPVATDVLKGELCEDFRTHWKIADPMASCSGGMAFAMTYGAIELIAFPCQLFLVGRGALMGQDLRFAYDDSGTVTAVYLNGEAFRTEWMPGQWKGFCRLGEK